LHHARKKLDGIVNEFANVGFSDGQRLAQVIRAGKRLNPLVEM
jgi:sulfur transfer protein SufE